MRYSTVLAVGLAAFASMSWAYEADAAKRRVVRRVGAGSAISAAIANALHSARYERGFICYSDHFHYGSSGVQSTRAKAERAAAGSWSSFVDFEYGPAWANYGRAGSKKMTCSQSGGGWDCSVEARPCKGV